MTHIIQKNLAVILIIALLMSVMVGVSNAETFAVGFYSKGTPPWAFGEQDPRKGIIDEILEAISAITQDTFIKKHATVARIKRDFGERYDIEPGSNPAWRPDQQAISVYTDPYYKATGVVVIRKEDNFPVNHVEDLKGKTVGIIRGYIFPGWMPEDGGYIAEEANNDNMLFRKFQAQRFDVFLANIPEAKYYAKELGLDIVIAKQITEWDISMRLHISKKSAIE